MQYEMVDFSKQMASEYHAQMSEAYRNYVDSLISAYPAQEQNRAHYAQFLKIAHVGVMNASVRLKGGTVVRKGTVVLYTPHETDHLSVQVWYRGCLAPMIVKTRKVKKL